MTIDEVTARELSRAAKQAQTWLEKRDALIRDSVAAGAGVREVARAVGLTHPAIIKIVARADGKQQNDQTTSSDEEPQ